MNSMNTSKMPLIYLKCNMVFSIQKYDVYCPHRLHCWIRTFDYRCSVR